MELLAEREGSIEQTPNGQEIQTRWKDGYREKDYPKSTDEVSSNQAMICGADGDTIRPNCGRGGGGGSGSDCDHDVTIGPIDRCVDLPDGRVEKVSYCVSNAILCIAGIDTCRLASIPCNASKIPGNPSFAGFITACLIALSNLCGKEILQILVTSHSCEVMVACLWEFGESLPI